MKVNDEVAAVLLKLPPSMRVILSSVKLLVARNDCPTFRSELELLLNQLSPLFPTVWLARMSAPGGRACA